MQESNGNEVVVNDSIPGGTVMCVGKDRELDIFHFAVFFHQKLITRGSASLEDSMQYILDALPEADNPSYLIFNGMLRDKGLIVSYSPLSNTEYNRFVNFFFQKAGLLPRTR